MTARTALAQVRRICLALPEVTERASHGSPAFFAGKKQFVHFWDDHHGDGELCVWCAAPPGAQEMLVAADPDLFFVPPYVGFRGWLGVRLDRGRDSEEIAGVLENAYRTVAPRRLAAQLGGRSGRGGPPADAVAGRREGYEQAHDERVIWIPGRPQEQERRDHQSEDRHPHREADEEGPQTVPLGGGRGQAKDPAHDREEQSQPSTDGGQQTQDQVGPALGSGRRRRRRRDQDVLQK